MEKLNLYLAIPIMIFIYIVSALFCGMLGFISGFKDYHDEIKPELKKFIGLLK